MYKLFSLRSNLALRLVLKILFMILLNHLLCELWSCIFRDKNSHIFERLSASKGCKDKCDIACFKILDHACTYSQLKTNSEMNS